MTMLESLLLLCCGPFILLHETINIQFKISTKCNTQILKGSAEPKERIFQFENIRPKYQGVSISEMLIIRFEKKFIYELAV
jgi:hypothetical protein